MKTAHSIRALSGIATVAALTLTLVVAGCEPKKRDPEAVRAELTQAVLKGVDRRGIHLSAEGYNALSHELLDVHVQTSEALYYAQRAVIHVDADGRYMSLKLFEVLNVSPIDEQAEPDEPRGDGRIRTMRVFTIENIPTSM